MDLIAFLVHDRPWTLGNVFCFVTKTHSPLLATLFKKKFEPLGCPLTTLSSCESLADLKAQLEMSFLGQSSIFWLSEDLIAEHSSIVLYSAGYKGPHSLGYCVKTATEVKEGMIAIEVPEELGYENFLKIYEFLYPQQTARVLSTVKQLFKAFPILNLSRAALLMHYCSLVGNRSEVFLKEWLPSLINPEKSLFELSSLLFSKKDYAFFHLWSGIKADYGDLFWTTFWSEQFFKATLFVSLMHAKQYTQAKRVAYRLPFSLIQKDWKYLVVDELKRAHDQIYRIEWNIKNGSVSHFEYFFLHFMTEK